MQQAKLFVLQLCEFFPPIIFFFAKNFFSFRLLGNNILVPTNNNLFVPTKIKLLIIKLIWNVIWKTCWDFLTAIKQEERLIKGGFIFKGFRSLDYWKFRLFLKGKVITKANLHLVCFSICWYLILILYTF